MARSSANFRMTSSGCVFMACLSPQRLKDYKQRLADLSEAIEKAIKHLYFTSLDSLKKDVGKLLRSRDLVSGFRNKLVDSCQLENGRRH
ncbi:hypothetical protein CRENBAI_019882 [Crenichthys baileyi]|uniref:Uncharacterized protein n=1 Tax=Crenichthys baileyi TaxID=28760 RepID=A0AAV9R7A6_9TELE